jgi:hypothetical protein
MHELSRSTRRQAEDKVSQKPSIGALWIRRHDGNRVEARYRMMNVHYVHQLSRLVCAERISFSCFGQEWSIPLAERDFCVAQYSLLLRSFSSRLLFTAFPSLTPEKNRQYHWPTNARAHSSLSPFHCIRCGAFGTTLESLSAVRRRSRSCQTSPSLSPLFAIV